MADVKRLKEQTVCTHCEKLLKDPRLLPCLHSYCTGCLLKFVKEEEDLICPTCFENHGIKEVPNLPKDVLGESLISQGRTGSEEQTMCSSCSMETEEAVDRCLDCSEFLCSECSSIHRRMRQTRDHEIITLNDYRKEDEQISHRSLFCDQHPNEELRYFCEKCKQVVCRECTMVLHKSHKYKYFEQSSSIREVLDILKSLTTKVQSKVVKAEKALEDVNATTDLITASITGLKNSVRNTATEMVRNIRVAEEEMINEIDRIQSRKFHGLKQQTKQLQNNLEVFGYGKIYAEHAFKYLSEVELYQLRDPLAKRLKVLNKKKISYVPVEENNLKHVRETRKGQRMAITSLGYLEVNGNVVINGCVRDLEDFENFNVAISEPSPDLKGIGVDIRGPGGELLSPVKKERDNPGSYGVDFQSERPGIHSVMITLDGVPVQRSPIEIVLGKPESPASGSPQPTTPRSVKSNRRKPGELWDVHGIAIAKEGEIVVTDSKCHRIQVFDKSGRFLRMFGSFGSESGQFNLPRGVAVSKEGQVMIADTGNGRIQIFDKDCKYLRGISCHGDNDEEFFHPHDVTLNEEGNIISLDADKSKVRIYNNHGDIITEFGSVGSADGQFINPSYVTSNQSGHILVSDLGNDRIQVFTDTGQFLLKFGRAGQGNGQLCWPTGIAVKGNGDIIVADSCNNRVQTFRADGCFVSCLGTECSKEDRVKSPQGLAVDENNAIYVADWGNNRVQVY